MTVDPSGRFAYVTNLDGNTISAYAINSSTGALTRLASSPLAGGGSPFYVTVDPSGQSAYVVNLFGNNVSAYTIDTSTGALSEVAGSPFAAVMQPSSVTVEPSGRFAYVTNECTARNCVKGDVSAYTINSSTGALSRIAGSPFAPGIEPFSMTVDPSGRFAYVANACGFSAGCLPGKVSAYTINSSTGALRAVAGSPFPAGKFPSSVIVDPAGRFVYVTNLLDNTVSAYTINSSTGALSEIAGSPFAAGGGSISVAIAAPARTTSVITLSPRSLAFGNVAINTSSATQSVTVTNTSVNAVAITSIALNGTAPGQFAFTDDCGKSLAGHAICTIKAQFAPSVVGAKTAYLDVNGGGGGCVRRNSRARVSRPITASSSRMANRTIGFRDVIIQFLGRRSRLTERLSTSDQRLSNSVIGPAWPILYFPFCSSH